jgi:hypothetical protein
MVGAYRNGAAAHVAVELQTVVAPLGKKRRRLGENGLLDAVTRCFRSTAFHALPADGANYRHSPPGASNFADHAKIE